MDVIRPWAREVTFKEFDACGLFGSLGGGSLSHVFVGFRALLWGSSVHGFKTNEFHLMNLSKVFYLVKLF